MAVSSRPLRRMVVQEVEDVEVREPKSKPKRKGMRRLGLGLLLLAVLVWFLPTILAKTPLLAWAFNRFGNLKGQVAIGSASLGWLSPPAISGVELRDEKNQPVVEHLSVAGSNSLFGLILSPSNLGRFHIEKPKLTLHLRTDGSNLEDVIAGYMTGESSSKKVGVEIDIADAEVEIIDETSKRSWRMDQFSLNVKLPAGDAEPIAVKASGRLADPQKPGKLSANVSLNLAVKDASKIVSDLALQTENFPLDLLQPVLARCGVQAQTTGWLSADLHTTLADKTASGKTTVEGAATAEGFALAMPALGKDQIRLTSFRADGKGSLGGERIDIERSTLVCDLGDAQLSGSVQLHDAAGRSNLTAAGLLRQRCELSGRVDLARLAAMLPQLLHVREGTQITGGEIRASFACRPQGNDPAAELAGGTPASQRPALAWQGQVQALGLRATDNGKQLAWARPIAAGFVAHEEPRGIVVETLQCDSDFLKITGSGTTDNLTASAAFNLKQLADQLGQFVELAPYQLAGEGSITAAWRRDAAQQFDAKSEIQLQNFQVMLSDQMPWREPSLVTTLSAKGKTDFTLKNTTVDTASLNLIAGADQFAATLTTPVKDLTGGGTWPLRLTAQGQLQNWLSRAAAFAPLTGYQAAGSGRLDAQLTASVVNITIAEVKIHADQFALASSSIYLGEPQVDLSATGSWIAKDRRLTINSAALTNSTMNLTAQDFVLSMPPSGPLELAGLVQYQANLGRLRQCFADRKQPSSWSLGGTMAGGARFKQTGGVIHCETAAEIANLTVAEVSGQQFQEPKVALNAVGEYDNKTKLIKIDKAELSSSLVAASALGKVGMSEQTLADINGLINYDLNRISDLLRPMFPAASPRSKMGKVRFFGRNTGPATWSGPLSLAAGRAATELKWDRAYLYGFDIGPAALKPKLEGGVLAIEPMQVPVSQGKLFLAPKVRLAPDPMELTMPPGKLAEKVQITPDMCDMFLKYVSPILAGVSEARGSFSLELLRCRLPLSNPKMGDLAGKFIVHDVAIGPGPLIRELAILLDREKPAQLRKESVVNFQMRQGRIYHDHMELIFPEFTIHTQGSVGIDDQTLALEAQMPIPPKWVENNPLPQSLKNQTLRLPIAGTLSRPQLDKAKFNEYFRQFARKAILGGVEEGLNRGLNELFRQPQK
jgi:translocation and assembly module TamB